MRSRPLFTRGSSLLTAAACVWVLVAGVHTLAQNRPPPIEVPFEFLKNEIILQVSVNDKNALRMMLDTGTDPSAVDIGTAKALGLKLAAVGGTASGGGATPHQVFATEFPEVVVGKLTAKKVEALAIDLSDVSNRMEIRVDGILGESFLDGRIVQIDYPHQVVRFYDRSPFGEKGAQSPAMIILPFRYHDALMIDDVYVNGHKTVAQIDTGSSGTFSLTPAAVSALGLDAEVQKAAASSSVGFNGTAENRAGTLKSVTVGKIAVDSPAVVFFGKGTGRDHEPWGVNIGNAFLKDYIVTINYRTKQITLARPS